MSKAELTVNNAKEVERETEKALLKAARMIGGSVEGHAKEACPVDTGLLRNSITFAIGGQPPAVTDYQSDTKDKNGERDTENSYMVEDMTYKQWKEWKERGKH